MTKEKNNFVKTIAENESKSVCLSFYVYGLLLSLIIIIIKYFDYYYHSYEKSQMNNILLLILIVTPLVIFFNSYKTTNNILKFISYLLGIIILEIIDFYTYKDNIKITTSYILYCIVIIAPLVLYSQVTKYKINKTEKKKKKDKLKKYKPEYNNKLLELERKEYEIKKNIEDFNKNLKMITIDDLKKGLEELDDLRKNLI